VNTGNEKKNNKHKEIAPASYGEKDVVCSGSVAECSRESVETMRWYNVGHVPRERALDATCQCRQRLNRRLKQMPVGN
jgi:hypothetical protein